MRRNQVVAIVVIVLLVALAAVWRLTRHPEDAATALATSGSAAHGPGTSASRAKGPRAPATPASVAGRVTRKADGSGIEGAVVTLSRNELEALFGGEDDSRVTAITDAQGAWSVPKLAPGRYAVGATAKGLMPTTIEKLIIAEGEHRTGVDLALDAGGVRVSGTISDVGGGAVPGAKIAVSRQSNTPFGTAGMTVLAGPDGKYEIMLPDGTFEMAVSHEDYTGAQREIEVAAAPLTVDFVLVPGGTIRGVVVTRDGGKPLPEAQVIASGGRTRFGGGGTARADDKGEFVLHGVAPGALRLNAAGRGYASTQPTVVELGIGEQIEGVKIVVDHAFSISGNVVETGTDKGIPGVRLGAFTFGGQVAIATDPSDQDGAFDIVGVRPGSYMMFALGETTMPEIGKTVEVVDKDVTGVKIEMGIGVTITGRVDPPAVAAISIEPAQVGIGNLFEAVKALLVQGTSDATGAFKLEHVPPGSFTLHAKVRDGRAGSLPLIVGKADMANIVIKLEDRAAIAGRVVDANGAPVARVHVRVVEKAEKDAASSFSINGRGGDNEVLTGADGSFRAVGLDAGVHELTVRDDQGAIPWADAARKAKPKEPVEITLAKAEHKTGVTLTIEARDGAIKGNVVDRDGKPVADCWVTAHVEGNKADRMEDFEDELATMQGKPPTITGADGAFAFEHLRKGDYTLTAETSKGTARIEQKGIKLGSTVKLVLAPLGTISGHVTLSGAPAKVFELSCDRGDLGEGRRFTEPDGAYSLERVPPGHIKCTADADDGRGSGEVDVPAGPVTLDIALAPWATITGTVVSVVDGKPIEGLKIIAAGNDFSQRSIADTLSGHGPTSDAAGRFVVPQVAAGKGTLEIMPKDTGLVELAKREYEVTAGQRLDLGTIKVVPPRTGDAGTLGFALTLDGETLTVSAVKAGGPAEAAGVQVGDKLTAVNGVPVATLTPNLAQTLLSSGSVTIGQPYQLAFDRGGTAVEVVLVGVRW